MSDQTKPSEGTTLRVTHLTDCPKCGTSNPPDTRYCEHCGASLAMAAAAGAQQARDDRKRGLWDRLRGR